MKNKNLVILGGIGLALYYLLKKDNKVSSQNSTTDKFNTPTLDLDDTLVSPQSFSLKDLTSNNRSIKLTEDVGDTKRMSRQLIFTPPYRGGARPTEFMERTSGVWQVIGNFPNLTTKKVCKNVAMGDVMPVGMPFDDERNCVMVADTKDVVKWVFTNEPKWNAEFGTKQTKGWSLDGMFPPMGKPQRKTYAVPSGISVGS